MKNYKRVQGEQEPKGEKSASKLILISYIYLDRAQGQTLEIWDLTKGRLVRWGNLVQHLNTLTIQKALQTKTIVKYLNPELRSPNMHKDSKWKFPTHLIGKDFIWCKIVLMNLVRVIGFLEDNIFYVVFLDEKHEFYPTEAK